MIYVFIIGIYPVFCQAPLPLSPPPVCRPLRADVPSLGLILSYKSAVGIKDGNRLILVDQLVPEH